MHTAGSTMFSCLSSVSIERIQARMTGKASSLMGYQASAANANNLAKAIKHNH
jgi:hypothetical protein